MNYNKRIPCSENQRVVNLKKSNPLNGKGVHNENQRVLCLVAGWAPAVTFVPIRRSSPLLVVHN